MFELERYLSLGVDAAIYFVLAGIATLLFLAKLALDATLGGAGTDLDAGDVDAHVDSTSAFTLFSTLSILSFFMGVGWMGLAARVSWGLGAAASAALATGFGSGLMLLSAALMHGLRKMAHTPRYDAGTALGRTASVYLTIPAKGEGQGQIEVSVSGRRKIMPAVSAAGEIPAFSSARIVDVGPDGVFVVDPRLLLGQNRRCPRRRRLRGRTREPSH